MNKGQENKEIQTLNKFNEYKDFIKDKQIEFVIKKTERVSSVVYMLCDFVPATEALNRDLKKTVHLLLETVICFPHLDGLSSHIVDEAHSKLQYLSSLLTLTFISGYVSDSNVEILKSEINYLHKHIEDLEQRSSSERGQLQIKSNLFTVNQSTPQVAQSKSAQIKNENIKASQSVAPKMSFKKVETKANLPKIRTQEDSSKKERDEKVISVIRDKGVVSIKDISSVIFDVSEKTIQRTLQNLIDKGQVKKEGERRWAKYSLN